MIERRTQVGAHRRHRLATRRALCGFAILLLMLVARTGRVESAERPNVVLIMADDMGFECVGANGGETYETPNLDELAKTGTRFEHCYSQPICTPSRVQIMTGIYNSRNYVRFGLLDPKAYTFGNLMRDAGYKTCIVGKWQLKGGFEGPGHFGFDDYCLWQLTRRPNRYPNPGLEVNGKEIDYENGEYGPDVVSDYACGFIERQAKTDEPFFLYYPMILPHWPFEPTPDSPDWDPKFRRDDKQEKGYGLRKQKHFVEMVAYADKMVGKVVAKLDEAGVRDDTLVLFTCDNGTFTNIVSRFRGREWQGGKGHMTDNGNHVPLIANWPGHVPAGKVNDDLVDFSDVLPTLAEVSGAEIPKKVTSDGRSFAPQLRGETGNPRDFVYCWYYRNGKPAPAGKDHAAGESARTKRYKLYHDGSLYDVPADFYERNPLDPSKLTDEQQAVQADLQKILDRFERAGFRDGLRKKSKPKPR